MKGFGEADQRLVSRFVDDQLAGAELVEFEKRLLCEPALRQACDDQRETRDWFRRERTAAEVVSPASPDLATRVLQEARRLPVGEPGTRIDPAGVLGEIELAEFGAIRLGRGLLAAAALVFVLSTLFSSGLLRSADSGRLEAVDQRRIEQIDREIEAAARRQGPEQRPR